MTLRASLQKLKQNIAQLRETLSRASAQRRMYPFQKKNNFLASQKLTVGSKDFEKS